MRRPYFGMMSNIEDGLAKYFAVENKTWPLFSLSLEKKANWNALIRK